MGTRHPSTALRRVQLPLPGGRKDLPDTGVSFAGASSNLEAGAGQGEVQRVSSRLFREALSREARGKPPLALLPPKPGTHQGLRTGRKSSSGCPRQLAPSERVTGSFRPGSFSFRCQGKTWCLQALRRP